MSGGWVQVDLPQPAEADPGCELPGSLLNHPLQGPKKWGGWAWLSPSLGDLILPLTDWTSFSSLAVKGASWGVGL